MNNRYETETRSRWGATDAYREHEQKTQNYTKEKWAEASDGLMAIFAEFATCKESGVSANSAEAQALVAKLQAHITANYYTCTDEIIAGLGKMYVADERFKKNIDKYGDGTAEFASKAIRLHCLKFGECVTVKCIGLDDPLMLRRGKIYKGKVSKLKWIAIVDETGEEYVYPPELFEFVYEY